MSRHRLDKRRAKRWPHYQSTPNRKSLRQTQTRDWLGQMAGVGVGAGVIACAAAFGGAAVLAGFPMDLSSPPSAPAGQRPLGPSWLPGVGAGLHASSPVFNPLFRDGVLLDAGVASDPEILHAALSEPLTLSVSGPIGRWVGGRWVFADPTVHPKTPCPDARLDLAAFLAWWRVNFPHLVPPVPPAGPVTAPPVATAPPPTAPPVVAVAASVEAESPPPAPSPAETPPAQVPAPVVEVSPVTVDPPALDLPPVTVDVPVVDVPVEVNVPVIDLPPVEIPPVDVSPITDPVTTVTDPITDSLPEPVGDVVDGVTSVLSAPDVPSQNATTGAVETTVPLAAAVDSVVAPVDGVGDSTRAGAEQHPTLLDTRATNSTSGNVLSGRGRLAGKDDGVRATGQIGRGSLVGSPSSPRGDGAGLNGGAAHHPHSYVGKHRAEDKSDGKSSEHKSDSKPGRHAKSSHAKSESHSKSSKSHSSSKSGGSKSHNSSGGSHSGGHRG